MKVNELILSEHDALVLEFNLKHAAAVGAIGASLLGNPKATASNDLPVHQPHQVTHVLPAPKPVDPKQQKMAAKIADRYNVDDKFAQDVVELAHKYQKPNFPKAKDLLAIIGIESSFDPEAHSGLRKDPAVGLTQVRAGVWNMDPESLKNPETAIKTAADILHLYYRKLHSREAAIAAYNVGWGEYRNGNNAEGYVGKYQNELKQYTGI